MKLFLIDGHALVFKMYYAFLGRPMINSKGVDTSILFGFTKYLLELIEREKPTHIAVSFDPPGGTFRNQMYPEYKANRAETPQLVIDALEPLTRIVLALDIPVLMLKGFEADDVIGSMAKRSAREGFDVYMVTPDKDYGQLVEPHIWQYRPGKAGGENEILGVKEICDKWKISSPDQVIDILALCGDTADNVPGVQGVGPVGAAKLLAKYGTLENIYAHIDELTARQKELFKAAEDHIALSKQLVTIKTDIPLETTADDMIYDSALTPELNAIFDEFEFFSLKKKIQSLPPSLRKTAQPVEDMPLFGDETAASGSAGTIASASGTAAPLFDLSYTEVIPEQFCTEIAGGQTSAEAIKNQTGTETIPGKTKKIAIVLKGETLYVATAAKEAGPAATTEKEEGTAATVPAGKVAKGPAKSFRTILEDPSVTKTGDDLKKIYKFLSSEGISLKGRLEDVTLMHYLLNPERSHSLEALVSAYLGVSLNTMPDTAGTGSLFDDVPEEDGPDMARQAVAVWHLSGKLAAEIEATGRENKTAFTENIKKLYDTIEEPLIGVLARMELNGVKVDLASLKEFAEGLRAQMLAKEAEVREIAGLPTLNVGSPKQVGEVIFEKLALDPKAKKPKSGNWPTDEQTLQELADRSPIIDAILDYRGTRKLLSTYIEPFPGYISPVDGRVHTTFNQALTSTGRLSSSNPNLQNIPIRTEQGREIRKAFVAGEPGWVMMSADYSQIELRVMAHICQDEHMCRAFNVGVDVHSATAAKIFHVDIEEVTPEQRRVAKTANFGIMYGISAFGLSQRLKCSRSEAKQIIDDYFASFPSIRSFIDTTLNDARRDGYVQTLFGRRRYIPDVNSHNANLRALAERNAVNAPVQGTAADIIKLAMASVDRRLTEGGLKSRLVLQIHDELLLEVPQEEIPEVSALLRAEMEGVVKLSIPLTVECNYGKTWLEAH